MPVGRWQKGKFGCFEGLTFLVRLDKLRGVIQSRVGSVKNKMNGCVRLGVTLGLAVILAACGGGGSPGPGDQGSVDPSNIGDAKTTGGSWSTQRLGANTNNLYPGNTYQPVGGEPSYGLWLSYADDGSVALNQTVASGSGRGFATSTRIGNLPTSASSNTTIAVVAGNWSMVAWTESDWATNPGYGSLFVRLKGGTFDSGAVKISSNFLGSAWDVRMAIDEAGRARAYWDEKDRSGVNGRFVNGVWTAQADVADWQNYAQRYLVGPDGQGWLFYARVINASTQHFFRRISAVDGVSAEIRLDDQAQGDVVSQRVASAEGLQGFTTVSFQQVASASAGCLAVRRMVAGVLQNAQCIAVTGETLPNNNYVSLASDVSGHAVLAWSTGAQDRALYASRRNAAGIWSPPAKLANVTDASSDFSWLSGLKTAISPSGQALLVYRASDSLLSLPTARAFVASAGGGWSAASVLANGMGNLNLALGFNAQGVPGVLQLMIGYGGTAAVMMSTWANDRWTSESLRSGMQLAFINGVSLSTVRLTSQGSTGWLALWDEGKGSTDSNGYRELWAAEFR